MCVRVCVFQLAAGRRGAERGARGKEGRKEVNDKQ